MFEKYVQDMKKNLKIEVEGLGLVILDLAAYLKSKYYWNYLESQSPARLLLIISKVFLILWAKIQKNVGLSSFNFVQIFHQKWLCDSLEKITRKVSSQPPKLKEYCSVVAKAIANAKEPRSMPSMSLQWKNRNFSKSSTNNIKKKLYPQRIKKLLLPTPLTLELLTLWTTCQIRLLFCLRSMKK